MTYTHPNDLNEFSAALTHFTEGRWHLDRWKTLRLRYGIYEQRQSGQHMVRAKVPGGRLTLDQARAIADANTAHAGGDIHITTRQGVQLYFVDQGKLPGLLESLSEGGVTTREASGNTFRAITACPHAGFCGSELTDAASVAGQLTKRWLRDPLVQHMPRKFKSTVSGCGQDCGLARIDDLGLIATERDGQFGFRVLAAGGLGIAPTQAIEVFDFVVEQDLPAVQEALARLHNRLSDRTNKNRARIKFLVKTLGAEDFVAQVHAEFAAVKDLDRPAWKALEWKTHNDNGTSVEVEVPLGWLSSAQLSGLAELAADAGGRELRLTRAQNIIAVGLNAKDAQGFVKGARKLGLDASGRKHALADLVACPGASTCAIGITDSFALAESLLDAQAEFEGLQGLKLRVSGCHNSCGHHHIADIGFHGVAKKIDGAPAPHYQLHLGGTAEAHGIVGPVIPAARVKQALRLILEAIKADKADDESVRDWAKRLGRKTIVEIIAPALADVDGNAIKHRFDIGADTPFVPPATATGECAAGSVVAEYLSDLAQVARRDAVREDKAGNTDKVAEKLNDALVYPARRLATIAGQDVHGLNTFDVLALVREHWSHDAVVLTRLDDAVNVDANDLDAALEVLSQWQAVADEAVERLLGDVPTYLAGAAQ